MRVFVVCVASFAVAGAAAGAVPVQTVVAPATVVAVAFDSVTVAYAAGDEPGGDCDRVRLCNVKSGTVTTLGRRTHCESTSTGRGIAAVSLARGRALWLHYVGGNTREWTLWTATRTRRTPRRLAFAARDVDDRPPIVLGEGDSSRLGDILPYAVGRSVIALHSNGARRFSWTAPARVVALSAGGGKLAVATQGGVVTLLDANGSVLDRQRFADEIDAVETTGDGVLVQRGRTLERGIRGVGTWTLPAGARLADVVAVNRVFYVLGGRVYGLWLETRRVEVVAVGSLAQAEGIRLAVAAGRRVTIRAS